MGGLDAKTSMRPKIDAANPNTREGGGILNESHISLSLFSVNFESDERTVSERCCRTSTQSVRLGTNKLRPDIH